MRRTKIQQPIGVDQWKLDQIRNLSKNGFSAEEISDQVDIDVIVVKEILELSFSKKTFGDSETQWE